MTDWDEIDQFYSSLDGELRETGQQMAPFVRRLRQHLPTTSVPFTSLVMFGLRLPEGEWYPAAEWKGDGLFEVSMRNWKTFRQKSGRRVVMDDAVSTFVEYAASLQSGGASLPAPVSKKKKKHAAKKKPAAKKPATGRKPANTKKPTTRS